MNRKIEDYDEGIELVSESGTYLRYDTGIYPKELFRFFAAMGKAAFKKLSEFGLMDEEGLLIISNRLSRLQSRITDQREVSSQESSDLPAEEYERAQYAGQAAEMRDSDLNRLRAIHSQKLIPHSISAWTELLGFKSKGATGPFIERMDEMGLIIVQKLPDGTKLALTDMAKRLLNLPSVT